MTFARFFDSSALHLTTKNMLVEYLLAVNQKHAGRIFVSCVTAAGGRVRAIGKHLCFPMAVTFSPVVWRGSSSRFRART